MNAETVSNCALNPSKNYSELRLHCKPLKQRILVAARKVEPRPHSAENVELSSNGLLIPFYQSDKLPPVKESDGFGSAVSADQRLQGGQKHLVDCCPLLEIRCLSERSKWAAPPGKRVGGSGYGEGRMLSNGTIAQRLRGLDHDFPRRVCMI
jgi:hypothetical protein